MTSTDLPEPPAELRYLLDTDTSIYIINKRPDSIKARFQALPNRSVAISTVTYYELYFGALHSQRVAQNLTALQRLCESIPALTWDTKAVAQTAAIRLMLKQRGQPIGASDLQIAGHALSLDITLVSNNLREFSRIDGLKLESWVDRPN